jgi:D-alanyl-D-alanine carboxypeptidase/D-alanyl-D-alanine-endopeptidase (penicillin-binding protein 4)
MHRQIRSRLLVVLLAAIVLAASAPARAAGDSRGPHRHRWFRNTALVVLAISAVAGAGALAYLIRPGEPAVHPQDRVLTELYASAGDPLLAAWFQRSGEEGVGAGGDTGKPGGIMGRLVVARAALRHWGPEHVFTTRAFASGTLQDGVLHGDLVIEGGGNPRFVVQDAIELARSLHDAGIQEVTGDLVVSSDFVMNSHTDAERSARDLRIVLDSGSWPQNLLEQYKARPTLRIAGLVRIGEPRADASLQRVAQRDSLPLVATVLEMNAAQPQVATILTRELGGLSEVVRLGGGGDPLLAQQIRLRGAGEEVHQDLELTARAVTRLAELLQADLQQHGLALNSVLPVKGQDPSLKEIDVWSGAAVLGSRETRELLVVLPTERGGIDTMVVLSRLDAASSTEVFLDAVSLASRRHGLNRTSWLDWGARPFEIRYDDPGRSRTGQLEQSGPVHRDRTDELEQSSQGDRSRTGQLEQSRQDDRGRTATLASSRRSNETVLRLRRDPGASRQAKRRSFALHGARKVQFLLAGRPVR